MRIIKNMKRFKLKTGLSEVIEINEKNFKEKTLLNPLYVNKGIDGKKRYFGICPACDNPIQIIGLFKKTNINPYGKHYNRDIKLAKHNETTYSFCPYASKNYGKMTNIELKENATEYEINIYNTLKENFDVAVYLLERSIGLKISEKMAEELLKWYISDCGHMYKWATLYNIPWILFFATCARNCYKKMVKKDSPIFKMIKQVSNVKLVQFKDSDWYVIENNGEFLKLYISMTFHQRKVEDDETFDIFELQLSTLDKNNLPKKINSITIKVNEYDFPNFITSKYIQKYRESEKSKNLLKIAEKIMPDI